MEIIPEGQFCRNRMNFSGGNHPWRAILSNQDEFLRRESSLLSNSVETGCISPVEIIPAQKFLQIRMNFSGGNHPWRAILSNQDVFSRWESSLHRNFFRSGCIFPLEIIPAQKFLQIRMHFPAGNHPCTEISSNQDEFLRWKSSLHRNFFKSGCISPLEIISAQKFLQIRMNFPVGNQADKLFRQEMVPALPMNVAS